MNKPKCPKCSSEEITIERNKKGLFLQCLTCPANYKLFDTSKEENLECPYCQDIFFTALTATTENNMEIIAEQNRTASERIAYENHVMNHKLTTLNKILGKFEEILKK